MTDDESREERIVQYQRRIQAVLCSELKLATNNIH